jgi:hypothetical protein
MLIPYGVHEDIMKNVKFEPRIIHSAATGDFHLKDKDAFSSDRYRGGGLHINMSFARADVDMKAAARMFMCSCLHPSGPDEMLPWRSLYRKPGQWRPVRYEGGEGFVDGFEYRSFGINMRPSGLMHLAHIIEKAVSIAEHFSKP